MPPHGGRGAHRSQRAVFSSLSGHWKAVLDAQGCALAQCGTGLLLQSAVALHRQEPRGWVSRCCCARCQQQSMPVRVAEGSWGHCQALLEARGQTDISALTDGHILQHRQTFIFSGADGAERCKAVLQGQGKAFYSKAVPSTVTGVPGPSSSPLLLRRLTCPAPPLACMASHGTHRL